MQTNSLKSFERLKSKKLIDFVFNNHSKTVFSPHLMAKYCLYDLSDSPLKVGFSISKKKLKRAHDRNQYKRWLRETYRTQKQDLVQYCIAKEQKVLVFFVVNKLLEASHFDTIKQEMRSLLEQIQAKLSKNA